MNLPDSTDVLVIGGGNAALCAAISAREAGANVALLECAPRSMRGGNSRHTRNLRAMHNEPTATLAASYTEDEYWQDLLKVTEGNTNERLARLMIRESYPLLRWLHDREIRFQPALSGSLNLDRTNAFFLGGGKALVNAQYRTAEKLGVQIFYDCKATDLQIDAGRFKSATVAKSGGRHDIRAQAVVLASGGFQANLPWMKEVWGAAADNFLIRGTPYNTGIMLKCLMEKGAVTVSDPTQCHAVAIDARGPRFDGGIVTRLDCICFGIVVNNLARRFYDEGEDFWPHRYATWGRLVALQPGQTAYAILDAKVENRFMPPAFPAICADSIGELARKIGVDANTLTETVQHYNDAVADGDYNPALLDNCSTRNLTPPKSHWALRLDTPPFSAYPLKPGITFTYLGVKVDEKARVNFAQNLPAENIFAAGEIMAGNILGKGYCAGTGMTIGGVFGRIAGETAAGLVTKR